jgi:hypothetical protein
VIATLLVLVLGQDAVARGDLRKLNPDQVQVVVRPGSNNLLSDAAVRELRRWRGQLAVELRMPVSRKEALRLNRLPHFTARIIQGSPRSRSLRRVRADSVRVMPQTPLPVKDRPCPDTMLQGRSGADEMLVAPDGIDSCLLDWLAARDGRR